MLETIRKIEGLQTLDTVQEKLSITRQSALNLLSKLKKMQHMTVWAGGKKKIYKITQRKQRPRDPGMFDIINKYSPMKLNEWYDHQVHGKYTVEDAIVDALLSKSFRAILASMHSYRHIKDWKRLYKNAKKHNLWQEVGAMHSLCRKYLRVPRMPAKYYSGRPKKTKYLIRQVPTREHKDILAEWNTHIPFRTGDLRKVEAC